MNLNNQFLCHEEQIKELFERVSKLEGDNNNLLNKTAKIENDKPDSIEDTISL